MSVMSDMDLAVREALGQVELWVHRRDKWMERNTDVHGDPVVDYRYWDESMADFNERLAECGEALADVVRKLMGA